MSVTNDAKNAGRPLRLVGGVLLAVGAAFLALWLSARGSDRHGAIFLLGGAVFFGLLGAPIWTIGYSITMLHRRRP